MSVTFKPEPRVIVSPTGNRYHKRGCKWIGNSPIVVPLSTAKRGYRKCRVCKP